MATSAGGEHHLTGPRLPKSPARAVADCFRCAEDRRVLRIYAVDLDGRSVGRVRLCDPCASTLEHGDDQVTGAA